VACGILGFIPVDTGSGVLCQGLELLEVAPLESVVLAPLELDWCVVLSSPPLVILPLMAPFLQLFNRLHPGCVNGVVSVGFCSVWVRIDAAMDATMAAASALEIPATLQ
jgi:hypothetical protein